MHQVVYNDKAMNKEEKRESMRKKQDQLEDVKRFLDELDLLRYKGDECVYISSYNPWRRIPGDLHEKMREVAVLREHELIAEIDELLK